MRVEVSIERVVLRGVNVRSRRQLMHALQAELAGLVETRGLPESLPRPANLRRLHSQPVELAHGPGKDTTLGHRIGERVYEALSTAHDSAQTRVRR